jgi:GNAT superfamily N-acetyltransferase
MRYRGLMSGTRDELLIDHSGARKAAELADELCLVYADAYGVSPDEHKVSAFRGRAMNALSRPGYDLVTARIGGRLIGFAFGYTLLDGDSYWWEGLRPDPPEGFADENGHRTFVLAEIEIRRSFQGSGIGQEISDALIAGRPEERATLAVNPGASETHAIYEHWGWRKVGQVPGSSGDYYDAYDLFVLPLASAGGR